MPPSVNRFDQAAMAIYSAVPPPAELTSGQIAAAPPPATGAVEMDAWTVSALEALSVSPVARGTGTPLAIPIDEHHAPVEPRFKTPEPPRRPPSRRDSQRRREAILKGAEGSRQRRHWDNGTAAHPGPAPR